MKEIVQGTEKIGVFNGKQTFIYFFYAEYIKDFACCQCNSLNYRIFLVGCTMNFWNICGIAQIWNREGDFWNRMVETSPHLCYNDQRGESNAV